MKLRPLGDRLVIKKLEVKEVTDSGIILAESAQEKPQLAEILAIGTGILRDEDNKDELKLGDRVIFSEYAGQDVKLDGEDYTILKLDDILAVVE